MSDHQDADDPRNGLDTLIVSDEVAAEMTQRTTASQERIRLADNALAWADRRHGLAVWMRFKIVPLALALLEAERELADARAALARPVSGRKDTTP